MTPEEFKNYFYENIDKLSKKIINIFNFNMEEFYDFSKNLIFSLNYIEKDYEIKINSDVFSATHLNEIINFFDKMEIDKKMRNKIIIKAPIMIVFDVSQIYAIFKTNYYKGYSILLFDKYLTYMYNENLEKNVYYNNYVIDSMLDNLKRGDRVEKNDFNDNWYEFYDLLTIYFEYHGNLNIPLDFKTLNGYQYDENGKPLGKWFFHQKRELQNNRLSDLTEEQKKLLMKMKSKVNKITFEEYYQMAKNYYEYYGNLNISLDFKTLNGYQYDEDGKPLGKWLYHQKREFQNNRLNDLTEEQKNLLMKVKFRTTKVVFEEYYQLAKKYYEHNGNLDVPFAFRTLNGFQYDEDGKFLGKWLYHQKRKIKNDRLDDLTEEQRNLLMKVKLNVPEMTFEEYYQLAKKYYEHNGNLDIPISFKTKDGYQYDESGFLLGKWLYYQKQIYRKKDSSKLTEEQIILLNKIGIKFFESELEEKFDELKSDYSRKNYYLKR